MKVALVHDYLTRLGGAERVLFALARAYPDAPIHTLLYDPKKMGGYLAGRDMRASFLNKLPEFFKSNKRLLLPFLPKAIESLDLSGYDLIISSSSAFAKGAIKNPKAVHICYCHSPARFLWDYKDEYQKDNRFGVLASFYILSCVVLELAIQKSTRSADALSHFCKRGIIKLAKKLAKTPKRLSF